MSLFFAVWIVLVAAAGGLAIGTLWGRLPPRGSCAASADCMADCAGCSRHPEAGRNAPGRAP